MLPCALETERLQKQLIVAVTEEDRAALDTEVAEHHASGVVSGHGCPPEGSGGGFTGPVGGALDHFSEGHDSSGGPVPRGLPEGDAVPDLQRASRQRPGVLLKSS